MRPRHWVKNFVVLLPLVIAESHQFHSKLLPGFQAFCIFSVAASIVYILNDIWDSQQDRQHPVKKNRPIASQAISPKQIKTTILMLFAALLILLALGGQSLILTIAFYIIGNALYSLWAKKIIYIDLLLIAVFFHLRLYAGVSLMKIQVDDLFYLFAFVSFFGLSCLKRFIEIKCHPGTVPGRIYSHRHLKWVASLGVSCAVISFCVLMLALQTQVFTSIYKNPITVVILLILFIAETFWLIYGAKHNKFLEDLTLLLHHDRVTQGILVTTLITLFIARSFLQFA